MPPVQVPLQQADEAVQSALSAVQLEAAAQVPVAESHWRLQQSVFTAHELPAPLQVDTDEAQVFATGSHAWEQHSLFDVHAEPVTVHLMPAPPPPPLPPVPLLVLPALPAVPVEELEPEPHPRAAVRSATRPSRTHTVDAWIFIATPAEQPTCRTLDRASSRRMAALLYRPGHPLLTFVHGGNSLLLWVVCGI